uniref:non-specific serine/threonine protein kinase n=1 Tax=Oryza punctata TaxID=4537 RepID=A0A0E0JDP2_ORYPU
MASIVWALLFFLLHLPTIATRSSAHFGGNNSVRCHPNQAAALLQLKQSFYSANSPIILPTWQDGTDCCSWEGVSCDASSHFVTVLDLSERGLYSYGFDPALFSLTSLQRLDLSMNSLGTTKDAEFDRLTSLTHLNLSNSGLDGQIPMGISKLVNLASLDLSKRYVNNNSDISFNESDDEIIFTGDSYNYLQESRLMSLVANLSNLKELYLDHMDMSTNVDEWCKTLAQSVPRLQVLSLDGCSLNTPIHHSLLRLHSLTVINLQSNPGIVVNLFPDFFMGFANLTVLRLSNNNLEGWFPDRFFQLKNLRILDLSFNMNLLGHLPKVPTSLETLRLEGTNFSYAKPISSSNFNMLKELGLEGKLISKDFLTSFGLLRSLCHLKLFNLELLGDSGSNLLSWIGDHKNLTGLTLFEVDFSSTVPSSVSNFKNLRSLRMFDCKLPRPIFSAIGNLVDLESLDMSNCNTYSSMLSSIGNLTNLKSLYINRPGFSGPMPAAIGNLKSLKSMTFSNCEFTGPMPSTIGNLTKLQILEIAACQFSGQIPYSIGQLKELRVLFIEGCNMSEFDAVPSYLMSLQLTSNELTGEFPKSFFELTSLIALEIDLNNLAGSVDFSSFQRLKKLRALNLSHNNLSVIMDDEGDNSSSTYLSELNELGLACCNITTFPSILTRLSDMSYLDLSCNKISGNIPKWIWQKWNSSLVHLNLSHNMLTSMEVTSYLLPFNRHFETLDLSSNMLQGQIPIPNLSAEFLDYSHNGFSSILPNFTLYLSKTWYLSMSKNNISGNVPHSICNSSLLVLNLAYNNFSGPFPSCLMEQNYFRNILNLRGNHFEGMLPTNVTRCAFQTIDLNGNKIEGRLPRALGNCTYLEVLDLGNNKIADTFPSWLGSLSNLRVLVLRSNRLYGSIGYTFEDKSGYHFSNLQIIDLASNNFTGNLHPQWLEKFISMKKYNNTGEIISHRPSISEGFYQDTVTISCKGFSMTFERILTTLTAIDLSDNALEGSIPESVGKLVSLHVLNLSHNAFSGRIPPQLGGITALESLDLSSNRISWEIPQELTNLTFLTVLNLSNNQLEGKIPESRQFATFESSSYEGNTALCGYPLPKCGSWSPPSAEPHAESSSEHIDIVMFLFVGVGFGVGFAAASPVKERLSIFIKCLLAFWTNIYTASQLEVG